MEQRDIDHVGESPIRSDAGNDSKIINLIAKVHIQPKYDGALPLLFQMSCFIIGTIPCWTN